MNKSWRILTALLVAIVFISGGHGEGILQIGGKNPLVKNIKILTQEGGRVSWSPDGRLIAYDRLGNDGTHDIWTMKTDGSEQKCLTCDSARLPAGNIGNPEWHPSGEYLVFQAQDTRLALPSRRVSLQRYVTSPGVGINNNLWVMTAKADAFWKLTSVESGRGALHPQFSHRGDQLLWSEIAMAGRGTPTMKLARFAVVDGQPRLSQVRTLSPGRFVFYETHGFSPDDSQILFSAYPRGGYYYDLEIYLWGLNTEKLTRLTDNEDWDEHAHFSPDGTRIMYSSSEGVTQTRAANNQELLRNPVKLELWLMNADGSNKQRMTYVNDPAAPEAVDDPIGAGFGDGSWHPEGQKFVVKLRPGRGTEMVALIELEKRE